MALGWSMRGSFVAVLLAAAVAGGSACAMSPQPAAGVTCRVAEGVKLPAGSGGADALCSAIEAAAAAQAPQASASVEVRVPAPSRLSATVTMADGRTLPEQKFASSDRDLTQGSFERFADAVAAAIAEAARR